MHLKICTFSVSLISVVILSAADLNILLLHTNDMHAHFEQENEFFGLCVNETSTTCHGGFARLKTEAEHCKQKAAANGRPTIFLNAGDSFHGSHYYTFFKWPMVSQFVSMLGIDVMCLGNHEFDDGISDLSQYIRHVKVPNVCSNLNLTLELSLVHPNLSASHVLTVNNVKIGIIGYLTPDTKYLSNTGKVQILDEIPSIRLEAKRLKESGINILVALGHSGYLKDQEIAKEVEDIDLVVGGHSHTLLYTGTPPDPADVPEGPYPTVITQPSGKQVPVVQAYYGTKYLGYLELDFDDNGNLKKWNGSPILLSGDIPRDPQVLTALQPYELDMRQKISMVVGYTKVLLDNNDMKCRYGECNIGNLITDAYVDYTTRHKGGTQGWQKTTIAINQAGSIRASIDTDTNKIHRGSINLGDILTVLPWGERIIIKNITGTELLEALEYSVRRYEETSNGYINEFLQVSGLQVTYDMNAHTGNRVVSVNVRCADCLVPEYFPLNKAQTYSVAMPEYIGTGGDGFSMFASLPYAGIFDEIDYMVVSDYIKTHSPVSPSIEGRIIIQNGTTKSGTTRITMSRVVVFPAILIYITMYYINLLY